MGFKTRVGFRQIKGKGGARGPGGGIGTEVVRHVAHCGHSQEKSVLQWSFEQRRKRSSEGSFKCQNKLLEFREIAPFH